MTIPIFKSHFSIGKSILTLNSPQGLENQEDSEGPRSVFDIVKNNSLETLVLIEDSFIGFLQAQKVCKELGVKLIFGIRFDVCENALDEDSIKNSKCNHKIVILPKNGEGCRDLNKIYTESKTKYNNFLDMNILKNMWNEDSLCLVIPFYDSFIHRNISSFNSCVLNFSFTNPTFFLESNGLPFDYLISNTVEKYCSVNDFKTEKVQSIFYENKKDFSSYLAYKLVCSRGSYAGRQSSLEKPNLDHLGSDEFCWESYADKYLNLK